jgi:hypothetical protein
MFFFLFLLQISTKSITSFDVDLNIRPISVLSIPKLPHQEVESRQPSIKQEPLMLYTKFMLAYSCETIHYFHLFYFILFLRDSLSLQNAIGQNEQNSESSLPVAAVKYLFS